MSIGIDKTFSPIINLPDVDRHVAQYVPSVSVQMVSSNYQHRIIIAEASMAGGNGEPSTLALDLALPLAMLKTVLHHPTVARYLRRVAHTVTQTHIHSHKHTHTHTRADPVRLLSFPSYLAHSSCFLASAVMPVSAGHCRLGLGISINETCGLGLSRNEVWCFVCPAVDMDHSRSSSLGSGCALLVIQD